MGSGVHWEAFWSRFPFHRSSLLTNWGSSALSSFSFPSFLTVPNYFPFSSLVFQTSKPFGLSLCVCVCALVEPEGKRNQRWAPITNLAETHLWKHEKGIQGGCLQLCTQVRPQSNQLLRLWASAKKADELFYHAKSMSAQRAKSWAAGIKVAEADGPLSVYSSWIQRWFGDLISKPAFSDCIWKPEEVKTIGFFIFFTGPGRIWFLIFVNWGNPSHVWSWAQARGLV